MTASSLLRGKEPAAPRPVDGTLLGALFESLATLSVRTFAQAGGCSTHHLRTRDQREVDLIVQDEEERILAIEVKLSPDIDDNDVRHLHWLARKDPDAVIDVMVITTGPRAYRRRDGVAVVPLALLGP